MTVRMPRALGRALAAAALVNAACAPPQSADTVAAAVMPAARDFDEMASRRVGATSRIPLAADAPDAYGSLRTLELFADEHVPNFLRALELIPGSAGPYAAAFQTLLYGGTVEPETKAAMGLQVGRMLESPYTVVHLRRILKATQTGRRLLAHIEQGGTARPAQEAALRYAAWLTEDVHGVDDERFRQVRGDYTDAQIVELTMTVSFFNYFTRLVEAAHLPVESWALETVASVPVVDRAPYPARVSLISDDEIEWAARLAGSRQRTRQDGDGFGLVNSQRAMNLVPDITSAWRAYTGSTGNGAEVDREIKLQVSFAVSTANGCRYCTLHQVLGLRRLGVNPEKLLQMQKDDSALTPRELVAVTFARKVTATPAAITDEDYAAVRDEFGERGALEVLLQTCNFAFMNRFTDNLGLPSEDEAIRVYREVYGSDWHK